MTKNVFSLKSTVLSKCASQSAAADQTMNRVFLKTAFFKAI